MPDIPTRRPHTIGVILWPAFVAALLLSIVFFAFFDPLALAGLLGQDWHPSRLAGYSIGFFLCWLCTSLSSTLTWVLLCPTPRPPASLDDDDSA